MNNLKQMKGLIIVGYQGIGKSSCSGPPNVIDLESGSFWIPGDNGSYREIDWYITYCQIALHLANQGFVVFTSSHKVVYDYFKAVINAKALPENIGNIVVFCPQSSMKEEWIARLQERYDKSGLEKDYKALMNAKERFMENIAELFDCGLPVLYPAYIDYDLRDYIYYARRKWCTVDTPVNDKAFVYGLEAVGTPDGYGNGSDTDERSN